MVFFLQAYDNVSVLATLVILNIGFLYDLTEQSSARKDVHIKYHL